MSYYGHKLYEVEGSNSNIKITTPSDFYIMRAIMDQAGTASKARSDILTLPVTSTAGLRLLEDEEPEAGIEE